MREGGGEFCISLLFVQKKFSPVSVSQDRQEKEEWREKRKKERDAAIERMKMKDGHLDILISPSVPAHDCRRIVAVRRLMPRRTSPTSLLWSTSSPRQHESANRCRQEAERRELEKFKEENPQALQQVAHRCWLGEAFFV